MKGAIIGNGLYSWEKNQDSIVKFSKYHGLIDLRTWSKVIDNCCQNGDESKCDFFNYPNKKCQSLVEQIVDQTWSSGLDVYNLYAECAGGISRNQMMKRIAQQGGFRNSLIAELHLLCFLNFNEYDFQKTIKLLYSSQKRTFSNFKLNLNHITSISRVLKFSISNIMG